MDASSGQGLVPTKFVWRLGGSHVFLCGSFTRWVETVRVRVCVCACESVCAWQVFGAALCVAVWRLPVRVCEEVWDSM